MAVHRPKALLLAALIAMPANVCFAASAPAETRTATAAAKIRHVIIIMQENHSFDSYFGTFPGANGIPANVCVPDPAHKRCVKPFVNTGKNLEGPHSHQAAVTDVDNGKMDGFIAAAEAAAKAGSKAGQAPREVMSYHTGADLPNYWAYARHYVLQDNLFASVSSWSLPAHLYMVSAWSAKCERGKPLTCKSDLFPKEDSLAFRDDKKGRNPIFDCRSETDAACNVELQAKYRLTAKKAALLHRVIHENCQPWNTIQQCTLAIRALSSSKLDVASRILFGLRSRTEIRNAQERDFPWTDITYLLHQHGISWKYYLFEGEEPDCEDDDDIHCPSRKQQTNTPSIWNPLPSFDTVNRDDEMRNLQPIAHFYRDAEQNKLPAVSWVIPNATVSEHAPHSIKAGQAYVTGLINTVMRSPAWNSTVIFLSWDDWGGFYDHVPPPAIDENGYGLRVPGLVISPYAKAGMIDHQPLSHDAYLKFIEDVFLGGERLDPKTDGRPDSRPTVREKLTGDLLDDFDFRQKPVPALILPNEHVYR